MIKALLGVIFFAGVLMANTLPGYETKRLENGLQVVVIPMDNGTGVITTDLFYRVGSRNETLGKSGIAHMLEHMNFKSTDNLKAGEFDEIVKKYGGMTNASTSFDSTHYFIKSSAQNLGKSLSLFAEMMENLALKDEEFQPERDVVAEERRWRTENSPTGFLYFNLFNHTYVYHPYHWMPIGFMEDIRNWTIEDIREFHKIYYQPKNAVVVVAGDIEPKKVFKAVEKEFGKIENCCEIPEVHEREPEQKGARRVYLKKSSEVEMVAITYHIPDYRHKDQVALSAISELLSSGKSSRLQRNLVDKKQLVNQIYSYNLELIDPGVFLLMAICNPGIKAEDVEKEMLKQLEGIKKGKIKKSELEKVKINTKADFIHSLESSSSVADLFGSYFIKGDISPLLEYEENLEKIEIETLAEVAQRYFRPENATTVILTK